MNDPPKVEPSPLCELDQLEDCIDEAAISIDQALIAVNAAHKHALALADAGERDAARIVLEKLRSAMGTWVMLLALLEERLELNTALKAAHCGRGQEGKFTKAPA